MTLLEFEVNKMEGMENWSPINHKRTLCGVTNTSAVQPRWSSFLSPQVNEAFGQ